MNKIIVTTTINKPTEATMKFANNSEWHLIVAGDTKTPHEYYKNLKNCTYLSPDDQEKISKELSDAIGWKSIRRRNFALIQAYNMGADIVATVDDDNIPYDNWGKDLLVGKEVEVDFYEIDDFVFDPIGVTKHNTLWHRGFPLECVKNRNYPLPIKKKVNCKIQADFWDGDPDIDAVCRIIQQPEIKFENFNPFSSNRISPFNSQNTFLTREMIPNYMMIPHIGRMDDIWGAYHLQHVHKNEKPYIVYNKASVYQDRNPHDLVIDMEQEIIGYRHNSNVIKNDIYDYLPNESKIALDLYKSYFKNL